MSDNYLSVLEPASARFTEKMSKFLSFLHPVHSAEEAKALVKEYTARYHDARHVCWAYILGPKADVWQLSDNGEPSGTAGRPILGQIKSRGLTDVIIIVVRYFGGIKLGTPGLIAAYKQSALVAIEEANVVEMTDMAEVIVEYPYECMNDVMKIAKGQGIEISTQDFGLQCRLTLRIARSESPRLRERLRDIEGTRVE